VVCFRGFAWSTRDPSCTAVLLLESDTPDALGCLGRSWLLIISLVLVSACSRQLKKSYATTLPST